MDGQNFENENNVTVDTTATEVSSTAEPAQETPAAEQPANNYQDYTTNVQPQVAVTTPVQPENKDTNVLLSSVWYWVFFLLFSDAVPDGLVLCLVSVVLSVQYLPISRVRPDWQRVD